MKVCIHASKAPKTPQAPQGPEVLPPTSCPPSAAPSAAGPARLGLRYGRFAVVHRLEADGLPDHLIVTMIVVIIIITRTIITISNKHAIIGSNNSLRGRARLPPKRSDSPSPRSPRSRVCHLEIALNTNIPNYRKAFI